MAASKKDKAVQIPIEGADSGSSETPSEPAANTADTAAEGANSSAAAGELEPEAAAEGAEEKAEEPEAKPADGAEEASSAEAADEPEPAPESEEDEVAKAKAETAEWKDKYLRLHAEWDTYRRRTAEQRAEEKQRATEKLVESLIPVIDDFERTIDYAQKNGETGLLSGVEAVRTKLVDTLVKSGVEVIDPKGQAFDALEAQAVGTVPDESVPDETVADVYQKGYRMGRKVIRPAMVTVSVGGPKREVPKEDEESK